jgi:hypothetical protein
MKRTFTVAEAHLMALYPVSLDPNDLLCEPSSIKYAHRATNKEESEKMFNPIIDKSEQSNNCVIEEIDEKVNDQIPLTTN